MELFWNYAIDFGYLVQVSAIFAYNVQLSCLETLRMNSISLLRIISEMGCSKCILEV